MSDGPALTISVDVEGWRQSTWDHSLELIEPAGTNTERVLDLLAAGGRRATMFVLGKFARKWPHIVKRIAAEGHEVASHGYGHIEIFKQTPAEFREDVSRAKDLLESITGKEVVGYRAPDFSIVRGTLWALSVLEETGHRYDSSIFPIRHSRYGIAWWPTTPVRVALPSGRTIVELSISTVRMLGRNWPVAGGGYHRLLAWPIIRWAIERNLRAGRPFISYCHPYEFNPHEFDTIDIRLPLKVRLHQNMGRRTIRRKFIRMMAVASIVPAFEVALDKQWPLYEMDKAPALVD